MTMVQLHSISVVAASRYLHTYLVKGGDEGGGKREGKYEQANDECSGCKRGRADAGARIY